MISTKRNTIIIIAGPTAVGKTSLAIKIAQHFNTKIISADSRQCYKELGIAVAKPSIEELNAVHHYFINSHSIHDEVNAGTYETYALYAANEIFEQNKIAVMVGGTGLYIKSFCEGIDEMPSIDESIRKEIVSNYERLGLEWLQNELKEKDNVFWQTAEQQNPQRLMRALEIYNATGKSITAFRQNKKQERPFNIIKIGLELSKEELNRNIHTRVDQMVEKGLVEEAKALLPFRNIKALQTVGYRELFEYFDGNCSLDFAVGRIKINTRQYAKRQMTWFKKDEEIKWFSPKGEEAIIELISNKKALN
jgi:tRNA dimethylallyltransferase